MQPRTVRLPALTQEEPHTLHHLMHHRLDERQVARDEAPSAELQALRRCTTSGSGTEARCGESEREPDPGFPLAQQYRPRPYDATNTIHQSRSDLGSCTAGQPPRTLPRIEPPEVPCFRSVCLHAL